MKLYKEKHVDDGAAVSKKLVSADKLRGYFDPPPSLRTIRTWQVNRMIPFVKIGAKVYFDPERVMDHLKRYNEICPKT